MSVNTTIIPHCLCTNNGLALCYFKHTIVNTSLHNIVCYRIVNACASMLREHGAAYRAFVRGETSSGGPLQVLRAALVMPPPFDHLSPAVRSSLVGLTERSMQKMEQLEATTSSLRAEVGSLRQEAGAARDRVDTLEQELIVAWGKEAKLSSEADALRRRAAELQQLLEASERRRLDQRAADRRLIEDRQAQLEQAAKMAETQAAALRASAAVAETRAVELRRRPAVDSVVLRRCLTEVVEGRVSRYTRRDLQKILGRL